MSFAAEVKKELTSLEVHREHAKAELSEYQLACYLYAFSSFMELMLQKKFEIAALVAEKNEEQILGRLTAKKICNKISQCIFLLVKWGCF